LDKTKLYVVVRADMAPGPQLAQAVHAALEFSTDFPSLTEVWRRHSNYLVVVAAPDEQALLDLANLAASLDLKHTVVREPDYGNTLTAVALEPHHACRKITSRFPLALKEKAMT
jgi:peptidyl-tRNA hydrolase